MKIIGFFNFINSGLAFLGSFLLVRLLGTEVYGNYYYLVSIATILYTFIEFGISNEIIVNKLVEFNKNKFFVEKKIILRCLFFILFTIILFPFLKLFNISNLIDLSLIISLTILLFINKLIQTLFQSVEKWILWGLVGLTIPLAKFVSLFNLDTYILNNVILQISILLFLFSYLILKVKVSKQSKIIKVDSSKLLFPLINFVTIILMRLDVLWIKSFLDDDSLGLYAFSSTLALAGPVIIGTSISTFFTKRFSNNLETDNLFPSKKTIKLIIVITILGMLISNPCISFIMGADKIHKYILPLLIFTYCFGIIFARFEPFFLNFNLLFFLKIRLLQLLILFMGLVINELFFETNLTNIVICVLITRMFYWITLLQITKKFYVKSKV